MRKSVILSLVGLLLLGMCFDANAQDNAYVATPVTISKEKVKDKDTGKIYYSHPVLAKQTLFSISKAYGVTLEEIYEANPSLHLDTQPLQQYQILRIPDKSSESSVQEPQKTVTAPASTTAVQVQEPQPSTAGSGDYMMHTVKWFEDLDAIAKKYGVSPEAIMRANGLSSPTVSRKMKLKIPLDGSYDIAEENAPAATEAEEQKSILEEITETVTETAESIFNFGNREVDASLIMPFNASKSPSDNNLDFYSGVCLALRDLQNEGIKAELSVYDCANGTMPVTEERFEKSDLIIGPVSTTDITNALNICSSTPIISPLDPKSAELARTYPNVIQVPTPAEVQCADLIDWLKQEMRSGDKVILFTEKGATPTANAASLIKILSESGVSYSTINYGILEHRNIASSLESLATANGTNRIVIASESEAFVNDAVRNINLLVYKKFNVALYGLSRIRNFETIEVENFHTTNLHVSMTYYVDYDSPKVQRFLMAYRALCKAEPGPFAFQGYDIAYYFIKNCSKNGRNWTNRLGNGVERGLQANFRFVQTENGGLINNAVRRIIYCDDFSIKTVN